MTWSIASYSATPGSNTGINGINIAEGCNASNINDAIRQLMADVAAALSSGALIGTSGNAATATLAANATKLANARTITLGGSLSGSGSFDGSANISISATVTGNAPTATKLATARTVSLTGDATGSGSFDGSANLSIATTVSHATAADSATTATSATSAAKWTTSRTISLTGGATGSVSMDGSANGSITVTLGNPGVSTLGGVKSKAASAGFYATGIDTSGNVTTAQPSTSDLSDGGTAATANTGTSGHTLGFNDTANTYSAKQTFSAGADMTPATTPATNAAGYLGAPQVTSATSRGCVMSDTGKEIFFTGSGTATIPANSSVAYPIGTTIEISADAGATVTIAITTDTLRFIPGNTTGSRTLTGPGTAIIQKKKSTEWWVSGAGVS